jgi:hypothetical protein
MGNSQPRDKMTGYVSDSAERSTLSLLRMDSVFQNSPPTVRNLDFDLLFLLFTMFHFVSISGLLSLSCSFLFVLQLCEARNRPRFGAWKSEARE